MPVNRPEPVTRPKTVPGACCNQRTTINFVSLAKLTINGLYVGKCAEQLVLLPSCRNSNLRAIQCQSIEHKASRPLFRVAAAAAGNDYDADLLDIVFQMFQI